MNRCQTCLKHENGKSAKDSTEADPQAARYKARSTKDGRIQQKDCAQQQVKRKPPLSRKTSSQRKEKTEFRIQQKD